MENSKIYCYQECIINNDGESEWLFNDEFFKTKEDINLVEIFKNNRWLECVEIFELDIKTTKTTEVSDFIYRENVLKMKEG